MQTSKELYQLLPSGDPDLYSYFKIQKLHLAKAFFSIFLSSQVFYFIAVPSVAGLFLSSQCLEALQG